MQLNKVLKGLMIALRVLLTRMQAMTRAAKA